MANYAVINGSFVTNIIVADSLEIAEEITNAKCVETEGHFVGIGYLWDGKKFFNPEEIIDVEEVTE